MCLATPSKVIKIKGKWAMIESGSHVRKANLSLLKNVKAGDYLLIHGDLALQKVEIKEAKQILQMIKKLNYQHA